MSVRTLSSQDPVVQVFFPCEEGTALLQAFGAARPEDFEFVEPKDFMDLRNSAFSGISEWDAFAEHVQGCTKCGEG